MRNARLGIVLCLLAASTVLSGCYWQREVESSQVGLVQPNGVTVTEVTGAGRYTNLGFYADLDVIDVSAKTVQWNDPDLVTQDKQPIGLSLAVTYQRKRDKESILTMWDNYRSEATSDQALEQQVLTRVPSVAKAVTTRYSLDEMLGVAEDQVGTTGGREAMTTDLFNLLKPQLDEFGVQLLDIRVENIDPDDAYLAQLAEKARAILGVELAKAEAQRLEQVLEQERRQTLIELEKAQRENQVNEERAKVYRTSPQFFELRRLELLKDVVGANDKIYFVPQGADLTMILSGQQNQIVPVSEPAQ